MRTGLFGFSFGIWSSIHTSLEYLVLGLKLILVFVLEVEHFAIFANWPVSALEEFRLLQ